MQYLYAVLFIIAGIILLFSGWRMYRSIVMLLGFIVGAVFGVIAIAFITVAASLPLVIVGAIIGGILGAILFRFVDFAAFVVLGGFAGFLLAKSIVPISIAPFVFWLVAIFLIVLGAIFVLVLKRAAIIATTSLIGAVLTISGLQQFISGTNMLSIQEQAEPRTILIVIVVAVLGAIVQVFGSRRAKTHLVQK